MGVRHASHALALLFLASASACSLPSGPSDARLFAGARVSTLGPGAEAAWRPHERLVLRGSVNALEINGSDTIEGVDYEGSVTLGASGVQADVYPFRSGFYLSAGAYANANGLGLDADVAPTETVTLGTTTYTGAQIGALTADADFGGAAGYLGAGWSGRLLQSRLELFADAGVFLQGDPRVGFTSTGVLANDPQFQADLAAEAAELESSLSNAKTYPLATIGVRLRF